MANEAHFGRDMFEFLADLALNNDREWFQANKARYESAVRGPLIRFVEDFGERLKGISSHMVADPRPVGGSIFRIYRDVRFSKDKSPYKTQAAVHFRHESGKDAHAAGYYLHMGPGDIFAGAGVWRPDSTSLAKIRAAIDGRAEEWRRITSDRTLLADHTIGGESLKRPPKGYDADHPLIEDLKKKDFFTTRHYDEDEVCSPDFIDLYADSCRVESRYMAFLSSAVGLPW